MAYTNSSIIAERQSSAVALGAAKSAVENGSAISINSVNANAVTVPYSKLKAVVSVNGFDASTDTITIVLVGWYQDGGTGIILGDATFTADGDFTDATGYVSDSVETFDLYGVAKIYAYCTAFTSAGTPAVKVSWL